MYSKNDYRYYELYHHGILGQKWYVRRFQNSDGSLTAEGKKRYGGASKAKSASSNSRNPSTAKEYQDRLNQLNTERAMQVNKYSYYSDMKQNVSKKLRTTDNPKKVEKYERDLKIIDGKMKKLEDNYQKSTKEHHRILDQLDNNDRYVYRTSKEDGDSLFDKQMLSTLKYEPKLRNELKNEYGNESFLTRLTTEPYDYTSRTAYKVADATDKRRSQKRWNNLHDDYGFTNGKVYYRTVHY